MFKRTLVLSVIVVMILSALPQATTADWVEPVPGTKTDDEFWHVTYGFETWWDTKFQPYPSKSSNRDPVMMEYKGKLWILWEGLLVPNSAADPVAYKGKLYMRSFTDKNGTPTWGDFIDVTPNAFYADHDNQKPRLITYNDKMYIFWMTYDRAQKPLGVPTARFDIMMRTYDGNELQQLTPPEIISRKDILAEGGYDRSPEVLVFKDKLYVMWFRENTETMLSDIMYRVFDGSIWSDVKILSDYPNNKTSNQFPFMTVYHDKASGKDRLYVTWQRSVKSEKWQDVVYSYSEDGNSWSAVTPLSRTIDISSAFVESTPILVSYNNPVTGKLELHSIWRTYKTENTHGSVYDNDLVTKVFDGTSWGPTRELSPASDTRDDTLPAAMSFGGKLYILWCTEDDSTKNGADYDIVQVIYDGLTYSTPTEVSRVGDTDKALFDDAEWWNEGDDYAVSLGTYTNAWGDKRLIATWWSFDYITGCCYDNPSAVHPTIVLKELVPADHDKDGHADGKDACPDDATDFRDTDGDGVCDEKDWKPMDPKVWLEPGSGGDDGEEMDPLPLYIILIVLLVAAVALMAFRGSGKKPRPKGEEPIEDDEEEGTAGASEEE